jgi:type II restriction/modification system DNA methylase subunit YeeA
MVTGKIWAQASETYNRDLGLEQRIQYIDNYLLSKAWYIAQIFPIRTTYERQLNTAMAWYTGHGEIFKVPLSTLQRSKKKATGTE